MCSQRSRTYPVKTKFVESGVHPAIQIQELDVEPAPEPALASFELDAKKPRHAAEQYPNYEIDMQKLITGGLDAYTDATNKPRGFMDAKVSLKDNKLNDAANLLDILTKHYSYQDGGLLSKSVDALNEMFAKKYNVPACPFTFSHKLAAIELKDEKTLTMVVEQETAKTLFVPGEEARPTELTEPVSFTSTYTLKLDANGKVQATLDEARLGNQEALDNVMKNFPSVYAEEDASEVVSIRSDSQKSLNM